MKWHGRKIVRGSDSFKSEDTVLLDKFTEVGEFSRVVKETEEDGTKKLEVKGLGDLFENGSVEPIMTFGVTPAQNVNGTINNKIGFRVGQGSGHTVKDLGKHSLTAANAFFMDKIDIINDAVVGEERIAGLIRVDGNRNGGRKQTQKQKGGERMEQITIILREWYWSIALFIILATGLAGMIKLLISIVKNSLS